MAYKRGLEKEEELRKEMAEKKEKSKCPMNANKEGPETPTQIPPPEFQTQEEAQKSNNIEPDSLRETYLEKLFQFQAVQVKRFK